MSLAQRRGQGLEGSMDALSIGSQKSSSKSTGKQAIADSWDAEDISSSGEDTETEGPSVRSALPGPPPPTPVTPGYGKERHELGFEDPYAVKDTSSPLQPKGNRDVKRPEKQTAVANRLIAGALGVKAPRRTDEQRAYDKAIREKEQKRLDKERAERKQAELDKEKAKESVWDD